jgi:hypothetical protein
VILDSCSAQGRYALLPVGPKLTQAEIVACIHPVHETVA